MKQPFYYKIKNYSFPPYTDRQQGCLCAAYVSFLYQTTLSVSPLNEGLLAK